MYDFRWRSTESAKSVLRESGELIYSHFACVLIESVAPHDSDRRLGSLKSTFAKACHGSRKKK
jgi:hypothetical protein